MTDDTIRPGSEPSREPEPERPEERVAEDTADDPGVPGPSTDIANEEPGVDASEVETAAGAGKDEPVAAEGAVAETIDESTGSAAEPVVDEAADTPVNAVAEPIEEMPDTGTDPVVEDAADTIVEESATATATDESASPASDVADAAAKSESQAVSTESAGSAESAVAAELGTDSDAAEIAARDDVFVWHPDHRGKSFDQVRAALAQDIAADQRQHRLAMDGAEESEQDALASVVSLERKWGPYDFDWAEQEPEDLADRILEFERERERRRELISWSDYRNAAPHVDEAQSIGERAPELSTSAKGLSLLLVVLLIVVILLAVWAL